MKPTTWDDSIPGERMIVAAAPRTNPSQETSHQVGVGLLTAIEWGISAETDLADMSPLFSGP
jgi:hypothetical protein